jgi:DNA-binding transcriptional LysR family regulator
VKLQQLRYLNEVVSQGFNISAAANALFTSQSGVSRQIRLLEEELGTTLLMRRGNRIDGLTEAGQEIATAARQVLVGTRELVDIAASFERGDQGSLVVATTHLHARYALLPTITAFSRKFPRTSLRLVETVPADIVELVLSGEADLGLTTEVGSRHAEHLTTLPVFTLSRSLITAAGHPLLRRKRPSLEEIAAYPLIVYDNKLTAGRTVAQAFERQGITPNIVLSAMDADVIKAYVAAGLGVAVIQTLAYDRRVDKDLRAMPVGHIFPDGKAVIVLRRRRHLRKYMYTFIEMISPQWTARRVKREVTPDSE